MYLDSVAWRKLALGEAMPFALAFMQALPHQQSAALSR
jgi:hypothetical protein